MLGQKCSKSIGNEEQMSKKIRCIWIEPEIALPKNYVKVLLAHDLAKVSNKMMYSGQRSVGMPKNLATIHTKTGCFCHKKEDVHESRMCSD